MDAMYEDVKMDLGVWIKDGGGTGVIKVKAERGTSRAEKWR